MEDVVGGTAMSRKNPCKPSDGVTTRGGSNYISIFISITITLIIFQLNYNYTVSSSITITLCGTKYIQHLLITGVYSFALLLNFNILYTIDKQI